MISLYNFKKNTFINAAVFYVFKLSKNNSTYSCVFLNLNSMRMYKRNDLLWHYSKPEFYYLDNDDDIFRGGNDFNLCKLLNVLI